MNETHAMIAIVLSVFALTVVVLHATNGWSVGLPPPPPNVLKPPTKPKPPFKPTGTGCRVIEIIITDRRNNEKGNQ